MFHGRMNPQMILRQFAWRGVGSIAFDPDSMWAPIFYNYNINNKIEISATVNGGEEKMTLKFNPNYIPATIIAKNVRPGFRPAQISPDQKPEPSFSLDITYDNQNMKNQTSHLLMGIDGLGIHVDNANSERRQAVIHGDVGLKRKIPVAYMGDGVSRLLSITIAIATTKNECKNCSPF